MLPEGEGFVLVGIPVLMMPGLCVWWVGIGVAVLLPPVVRAWWRANDCLRRKMLVGAGYFLAIVLALVVVDFWRCWSQYHPLVRQDFWSVLLKYQQCCWAFAAYLLAPLLAATTGATLLVAALKWTSERNWPQTENERA
jgi:hypothetical protein